MSLSNIRRKYINEKCTIDFRNVQYYLEMHNIISDTLEFDYYGRNWDAFYDCITDMLGEPFCVEIIGLDHIERLFGDAAAKMLKALKDAKYCYDGEFADRLKIVLVNGEHRVEIK